MMSLRVGLTVQTDGLDVLVVRAHRRSFDGKGLALRQLDRHLLEERTTEDKDSVRRIYLIET